MILASASVAAAQSDYKKFEFFAGYSYHAISNGLGEGDVIRDPETFNGLNTSIIVLH